jgi:elongation factor G
MPATSSRSPASRNTTTGDTLCAERKPIILERMEFPEPVIELAVEPKTKADQEKMGIALNRLAAEDPSFRVSTDHESGQTDHQGHGRASPRHPRRPHEARVQGRSQCRRAAGGLSRISLAKKVDIDYTHKKQSGGSGQFGRVKVRVDPRRARFGLHQFFDDRQGRQHPEGIYPVVEKGMRESPRPVAHRLPDHRLRGHADGRRYHDVDSSALAFEIAPARRCAKRRRRPASSCSSRS